MMSGRGEVITFYSYKGGTGRSMALANIACLLAQRGGSVLAIDWDLEAPGLHRYFEPFLRSDQQDKPGLIDLFYDVREHGRADDLELHKYVQATSFPNLAFLPAGRFGGDYSTRINTFSWTSFFAEHPQFFEAFAQRLSSSFDHVLIDSRTGHTDISSICTTLMPDTLVVVFTPNRQSLTGVAELVTRATEYRRTSNDVRTLTVFPLPSRIDTNYPDLMTLWRDGDNGWQRQFQGVLRTAYELDDDDVDELETYFDDVQIFHVGQYAFGEPVFVLNQRTTDKSKVANSYAALIGYLDRGGPWVPAEPLERTPQEPVAVPAAAARRWVPALIVPLVTLATLIGIALPFYVRHQRASRQLEAYQKVVNLDDTPSPALRALLLVEATQGLQGSRRAAAAGKLRALYPVFARPVLQWRAPTSAPDAVFSAEGDRILIYDSSERNALGTITLWSSDSGVKIAEWVGPNEAMRFVSETRDTFVSSSGTLLTLWNGDAVVRDYDLRKFGLQDTTSMSLSPKGGFLITVDQLGAVQFWAVLDRADPRPLRSVTLSGIGQPEVACGGAGLCAVWRGRNLELHRLPNGGVDRFSRDDGALVRFSPDGKKLAVGNAPGLQIFDSTLRRIATINAGQRVIGVSFFPDAQTIAAYTADGRIGTWTNGRRDSSTVAPYGLNDARGVQIYGLSDGRMAIARDTEVAIVTPGASESAMWIDASAPIARIVDDGRSRRVAVITEWDVSVWDVGRNTDPPPAADDALVRAMCRRVRRVLTRAEWSEYFPDRAYQPTCREENALAVD